MISNEATNWSKLLPKKVDGCLQTLHKHVYCIIVNWLALITCPTFIRQYGSLVTNPRKNFLDNTINFRFVFFDMEIPRLAF